MRAVEEYAVHKYMEVFTLYLYLVFIFLLVQIWLLRKDIDKSGVKIKLFSNDSFSRKNYAFASFFGVFFFIVSAVFNEIILPDAYLEALMILVPVGLVLFAYHWYNTLEKCAPERSLPQELTSFGNFFKKI